VVNFWYINEGYDRSAEPRIGASDIPALIPNPEKPTETLAGYERTPITVWLEKTGHKQHDPAGLPAEMGHYLEGKALELFIRNTFGHTFAVHFLRQKLACDLYGAQPANTQIGGFKHSVSFFRNGMVVHPDCVYDGAYGESGTVQAFGLRIDFKKPFLIEAKSANYWAAKRPAGSIVSGYDFDLKTWQGIPLKHYMQIQFQLALLEIDTAYLVLLHNTSEFHVWEIKANGKHQSRLIDLAGKMVWHIENDRQPADMAINAKDIIAMYPDLKQDDFVLVSGEEREAAVSLAKKYLDAERQEKLWKSKKDDARDSLAVLLKDRPELRDGEGPIAKWQVRRGAERIVSLSKLKDDANAYKYLQRKKLLYTSPETRFVSVDYKGE
jgi:hypothetical protein